MRAYSNSQRSRRAQARFCICVGCILLCLAYGLSLPHAAKVKTAWATIRGKVKTSRPYDAIVQVLDLNKGLPACDACSTSLDGGGGYQIQEIPPGDYRLVAIDQKQFFQSDEKRRQLDDGDDTPINFELSKPVPGHIK